MRQPSMRGTQAARIWPNKSGNLPNLKCSGWPYPIIQMIINNFFDRYWTGLEFLANIQLQN